jgi:uncharacterized membrane protein YjjP (DUF1212 family)
MTAQKFVLELGRAMHALGSPSYRVEDTMDACSRALGLEGAFFSTPTAIFASLGPRGSEPHTSLLRVVPDDQDLGRLAELYAIRDAVVQGQDSPERGLARVQAVLAAGSRGGWLRDLAAHALAGAGAAVLFGGGFHEVAVAGGAGLLVAAIGAFASGRPRFADVGAPFACALAAFVVHGVAARWLPIDAKLATVAAIVVLLPGLSFTTALAELAIRHLASGSARLLGTLAVLLTMVVGVGIGDRLGEMAFGKPMPVGEAARLPLHWHFGALAATWLAYVILLRASRAQTGWVLLAVAVGYGGARLGSLWLAPELGAFVGAFLVTVLGNLFAHWRRRPAAVVRTPGLLLLVPGSLGFRGLATAVDGQFSTSVEFLFHMLLVGGAIVAGLLIAGAVLPPPLDVEPDSRSTPRDAPM